MPLIEWINETNETTRKIKREEKSTTKMTMGIYRFRVFAFWFAFFSEFFFFEFFWWRKAPYNCSIVVCVMINDFCFESTKTTHTSITHIYRIIFRMSLWEKYANLRWNMGSIWGMKTFFYNDSIETSRRNCALRDYNILQADGFVEWMNGIDEVEIVFLISL